MYDHKVVIGAELEGGEELLWSAQPRQGLILRKSDNWMIPFSIFWAVFAINWEIEAISSGAPTIAILIGGIFVIFGLQLTVGRFFRDAALREKTFYGITDRRVIILSGIKEKQAIYLRRPEIETVSQPENEPGLLLLDPGSETAPNPIGIPTRRKPIYCFDNLEDTDTPMHILNESPHHRFG